jgi:hypothetical protein
MPDIDERIVEAQHRSIDTTEYEPSVVWVGKGWFEKSDGLRSVVCRVVLGELVKNVGCLSTSKL